ncbi:hypothetical protein BC830DRAFT_1113088 [Chytriomyces sp. MP71]|nr:hypothetical protein BC830DRAFT_1113088 [Chytriomyces sp. MP71]
MDSLPVELVQSIFALLPPLSVLKFTRINKRIRSSIVSESFAALSLCHLTRSDLTTSLNLAILFSVGVPATFKTVYARLLANNAVITLRGAERLLLKNGSVLPSMIPQQIGLVTSLRSLDLTGGKASGPLPAELSLLKNLNTLNLKGNKHDSEVPDLSGLPYLTILNLSFNELSGRLDSAKFPTSLVRLLLDGNQLEGTISDMSAFKNLLHFSACGNRLTGNIPDSFCRGCPLLEVLLLKNNQLSGPLTPAMSRWTALQVLDLSLNHLTGGMRDVCQCLALRTLDLSCNNFSGPLDPGLGNLRDLWTLNLAKNHFSGPVPAAVGNLRALVRLWIEDNDLTGRLPADFGNLHQLSFVSLSGNLLVTKLPEGIEYCPEGLITGLREQRSVRQERTRQWLRHIFRSK